MLARDEGRLQRDLQLCYFRWGRLPADRFGILGVPHRSTTKLYTGRANRQDQNQTRIQTMSYEQKRKTHSVKHKRTPCPRLREVTMGPVLWVSTASR